MDTIVNDVKPDFILWTGDNPAHDEYNSTQAEVIQVTTMFTYLLQYKYNFTIPIYPSLGKYFNNYY